MTPHQAHLSKLKRRRSTLKFWFKHEQGLLLWARTDLERDERAARVRRLGWQIIDLNEQIRALDYGPLPGEFSGGELCVPHYLLDVT